MNEAQTGCEGLKSWGLWLELGVLHCPHRWEPPGGHGVGLGGPLFLPSAQPHQRPLWRCPIPTAPRAGGLDGSPQSPCKSPQGPSGAPQFGGVGGRH